MSHQASPGPSQLAAPRSKQKSGPVGVVAGADDLKYQTKYKDLKRKVKEIEADNDKLHFKVLQSKRNIQRMKLERAILYERLYAVPPSPEMRDRQPLPSTRESNVSSHHRSRDVHHSHMDVDPPHAEYNRPPGHARVSDLRTSGTAGDGSIAPNAIHVHGHRGRRQNDDLRDIGRHSGMPNPSQHSMSVHPMDLPPAIGTPSAHTSSQRHHERVKSHSSRSRQPHPHMYQPAHHTPQYGDGVPAMPHQMHRSPPISERDRSRRLDIHELAGPHTDPHNHHQLRGMSPQGHLMDPRASRHQSGPPSRYTERDEYLDRQRMERDRDMEWARERERERRDAGPSRMPYPERYTRSHEEPPFIHDRGRDDPTYNHEYSMHRLHSPEDYRDDRSPQPSSYPKDWERVDESRKMTVDDRDAPGQRGGNLPKIRMTPKKPGEPGFDSPDY